MDKKTYRSRMREKLQQMDDFKYRDLSAAIQMKLEGLQDWKRASTVALTISSEREVDTNPLILNAWQQGKRVAVPKCIPSSKGMVFRILTSYDELETVYFGLKEPIPSKTELISQDHIDLAIIPGLVYDRRGFRIGYGGGYFDRWLKNYKGASLSLAFSQQVVPQLPEESFDIPVQQIVTEDEVIKCNDGTE
ncbi:5-formyltetrahydrofolate cyclo-ligase [Metabacillus sp. RGM 3146]|uniref:5-formyltetrahydrofolate cyclo-ligase n=1 Tax=Metabacillus sp. RGM 3146 TaxID=3401092 RepID=UPI003B9D2782